MEITRKLAASMAGRTLTAAKAHLKAKGIKQTLASGLLAEVAKLDALRADKARARRLPAPARAPVRLPKGTPAMRLATARISAVNHALGRAIRVGANDELDVLLSADPALIGVRQIDCTDRSLYRGKFKGWACNYRKTIVTVPATWRVRVQRRGLEMVDGMMTLDAAPVEATGCELFAACWIVQGRGNAVEAVRGYIARRDGANYHAATIDQALSGLARKQRTLAFVAHLASADLGAMVSKCGSARCSVGDATASGACEYGIKSWCASVGLDFAAGAATLAEVYAAYQREPRLEARATILRVLRRQRALVGDCHA